jgi:putative membrane protein
VRTATALIGFGFTIVQFFERYKHMDGVHAGLRPDMPRYLGIALIASGIVALIISIWQYHEGLRYLWNGHFRPIAGIDEKIWKTPLLTIAILLALIGVCALGAVFLRLL